MRTPISAIWFPSLLLVMALPSVTPAQSETDLAPTIPSADPSQTTQPLTLKLQPSRWTTEMVRLAQSGIEESVMLAFVGNSGSFGLTAEQIVYLTELGVSGRVIGTMLRHDQEFSSSVSPPIITNEASPSAAAEPSHAEPAIANPTLVELADAPGKMPQPEVESRILADQSAALPAAGPKSTEPDRSTALITPRSAPQKKLYPVREPYPVELTAPIVFLDSPRF